MPGVNMPFAACKPLKLLFFLILPFSLRAQDLVDATSLNNKVMAGYQGWFRTPGDGGDNRGWAHLFNKSLSYPAFDSWPDMREYSADEKSVVPGFHYPDGRRAYLYSAQNPKVVLRHFQWMEQYGIDGVWLSEFCSHFPGGGQQADSAAVMTIMRNVRAAAKATGRTWAFMWDMSGFGAKTPKSVLYHIIVDQWKKMVDEGVTSDPRYLHHAGRPVLLLWGFFPGRPASQPAYMNPVLDFLQAKGKYQAAVVAGVDDRWREGTADFQDMLMKMTALQPWSVGRRVIDSLTGYPVANTSKWAADIAKCKANNVIFMPVINPGTNVAGPPPVPPARPTIPRRMGNYLWEQFAAASKTGVINAVFIAMFDEINEGTQIMKVTNHPPVQFPFLTYNGATSDYYLRLAGLGGKMLKNHIPVPEVMPISPFDQDTWYTIRNRSNNLLLGVRAKANELITLPSGNQEIAGQWQLLYDTKGYFKIRNHASGELLCCIADGAVALHPDGDDPSLLWHLEWDGSGGCHIINKSNGKALSSEGGTVAGVADLRGAPQLCWQVIEPLH